MAKINLNFNIPISEIQKDSSSNKVVINGTAINAGTTRNMTIFEADELQKSATTLSKRPLLKDHNNSVDSIVGKVINSYYDSQSESVKFEAEVMDDVVKSKIDMGLITAVSVGANVESIKEVYDNNDKFMGYKVSGIDFLELSLVAVPADPNAGFTKAICEKFTPVNESNKVEETKMAEELSKLEQVKAERLLIEQEMESMMLELSKIEAQKLKEELEKSKQVTVQKIEDKTTATIPTVSESQDNYQFMKGDDVLGYGISMSYDSNTSLNRLRRN
jgi:hypothetical protein